MKFPETKQLDNIRINNLAHELGAIKGLTLYSDNIWKSHQWSEEGRRTGKATNDRIRFGINVFSK